MPEATTLLLFLAAAVALIAIPGPNLLCFATRSVTQGPRAGAAPALGVEAGTLVHVGAAAAGLSALIASSAAAFSVLKYLGAAYLLRRVLRRRAGRGPAVRGRRGRARAPLAAAGAGARRITAGIYVGLGAFAGLGHP
jgi:hypothetical protein